MSTLINVSLVLVHQSSSGELIENIRHEIFMLGYLMFLMSQRFSYVWDLHTKFTDDIVICCPVIFSSLCAIWARSHSMMVFRAWLICHTLFEFLFFFYVLFLLGWKTENWKHSRMCKIMVFVWVSFRWASYSKNFIWICWFF